MVPRPPPRASGTPARRQFSVIVAQALILVWDRWDTPETTRTLFLAFYGFAEVFYFIELCALWMTKEVDPIAKLTRIAPFSPIQDQSPTDPQPDSLPRTKSHGGVPGLVPRTNRNLGNLPPTFWLNLTAFWSSIEMRAKILGTRSNFRTRGLGPRF